MSIALRCRDFARNRRRPRRNDDRSVGMTLRDSIINHLSVIGSVCGRGADRTFYLIDGSSRHHQRHPDANSTATISWVSVLTATWSFRHRRGDRNGVLLVEPFAFAGSAGAVDQDMQRLVVHDPIWQDFRPRLRRLNVVLVGIWIRTPKHSAIERRVPSVWRSGWWSTRRSASPVSIAMSE